MWYKLLPFLTYWDLNWNFNLVKKFKINHSAFDPYSVPTGPWDLLLILERHSKTLLGTAWFWGWLHQCSSCSSCFQQDMNMTFICKVATLDTSKSVIYFSEGHLPWASGYFSSSDPQIVILPQVIYLSQLCRLGQQSILRYFSPGKVIEFFLPCLRAKRDLWERAWWKRIKFWTMWRERDPFHPFI